MRIRFNAFSKDTSGSYTETVLVATKKELIAKFNIFKENVPFSRWYSEHENLDDFPKVDQWLESPELQ